MTAKNSSPIIKKIEVGKFYFIHDRSRSGHPGLVVDKDDLKNRYLIVRFDSDKPGQPTKEIRGIRHITKLKHSTDPKIVNSYARNRPFLCKRKDIGKELSDLKIHNDDLPLIKTIAKRSPELSSSLKK